MKELPVFTCQAFIFKINPTTKKSWIPSSSKAIDVNFFYDSTKQCYRIISVEDTPTGKKAIINSTLTEKMVFKKTSQKFGQWADPKSGGVHGLGFCSEADLNKFVNQFNQCVEATKNTTTNASNLGGRLAPIQLETQAQPIANGDSLPPPQPPQAISPLHLNSSSTSGLHPITLNSMSTTLTGGLSNSNSVATAAAASVVAQPIAAGHPSQAVTNMPTNNQMQSDQNQLQQQLRAAQAQVRRIEAELNSAKRQAASAVPGFGWPSAAEHPNETATLNGGGAGLSHITATRNLSGAEAENLELRECLARLDLNDSADSGSSGGNERKMATISNRLPTSSLVCPARSPNSSIQPEDTIRSLYARLGNVLREAVELHSQLGLLLPRGVPGAPPG